MLQLLDSLIPKHASRFLGAALFIVWALTPACRRGETPTWEQQSAQVTADPSPTVKLPPSQVAPLHSGEGLRFITYNVKNWVTEENSKGKPHPKLEKEKAAVVSLISRNRPDVLGICEIGNREDLAELQGRLKAAGWDLPYVVHVGGIDPVRHLALLSRFPITATASPEETEYQMDGRIMAINRGILDASLEAGGKTYRFIGVYLKSRREAQEGDQEIIRLHEAKLVRSHVNRILSAQPDARLVVYGDFNDTRSTHTLKTLTGDNNSPNYLFMIPAKDSRQENWTHYWEQADSYTRIDFITVSRALRPDTDLKASHLIDDKDWNEASDHRPVLAVFR